MGKFPAGLATALMLGLASTAHSAEIVAPAPASIAQTILTLAAATDTTIASAGSRRYLCVMNIGTGLVTLGFDQAAVAGSGWALTAAGQVGDQGGSMCWESATVSASAVHAISTAGSTVAVLEAK